MNVRAVPAVAVLMTAAFLCRPLPARADEASPADLSEGKRLYHGAEFTAAVARLHRAVQELEPRRSVETAREQLTDAYLHLGLAYSAIGDADAAKDAFRGVLALDPARRLDAEIYAPKIVELFERARLSVTSEARPAEPSRERPITVEWSRKDVLYSARMRPFAGASMLGAPESLIDGPFSPSLRYGVADRMGFETLQVTVRLPGTRGYVRASTEHASSSGSSRSGPILSSVGAPARTLERRHWTDVRTYELSWMKTVHDRGRLKLRAALGYRHLRIDDSASDAMHDIALGTSFRTQVYVSSEVRAHGLRVGGDGSLLVARLPLGITTHLDLELGATAFAGSDSGHAALTEIDNGKFTTRQEEPYRRRYAGDLGLDALVQARLEFGRTAYLRVGYSGDFTRRRAGIGQARHSSQGLLVGIGLRIGR